MGIINLTQNSFSQTAQNLYTDEHHNFCEASLKLADEHIKNGAQILDIGAVATNPTIKNALIDSFTELAILRPFLKVLKSKINSEILISIDTYSPEVAFHLANENLIDIINDVYGSRKTETFSIKIKKSIQNYTMDMMDVVQQFSLGYILMHMSGNIESIPEAPNTKNVDEYLSSVLEFFKFQKEKLLKKNIDFCVFDPGIGGGRFGKTTDQNIALMSKEFLSTLAKLGWPILIGVSRKSFIQNLYPDLVNPLSRDAISKKMELECFQTGVKIIRSHKVGFLNQKQR